MKKIVFLTMFFCLASVVCAFAAKSSSASKDESSASSEAKTSKSKPPVSNVIFDFSSEKAVSVLTFWRKIGDDGKKGKRFSVAFKKPFDYSAKPRIKRLAPGTYYLDSFQVTYDRYFVVSQGGHFLLRNGWDDEENKPKYLSFTVKENEEIILPGVEIIVFEDIKKATLGGYFIAQGIGFNFITPNNDIFTIGTSVKTEE